MSKWNETRIGGACLMIGTMVFLVTVGMEYRLGWIGLYGGPEDVLAFIRTEWPALQRIWTWQMLSGVVVLLAYIAFLKETRGFKRLLWALLALGNTLTTVAFLLTLGSYGPAMSALDSSPELFETVRGGISALYRSGRISPLFFLVLFCWESFGKKGMISRPLGITTIITMVVILIIGSAFGLSAKIYGLSYFLLPLVLGYSAFKEGTTSARTIDLKSKGNTKEL